MLPYPAADAQVDVQAFTHDFVCVDARTGAIGVLGAVFIHYGNQNRFSLNQSLGKLGHQLKNAFEVEPFADCHDDFLEQGNLLITQKKLVFNVFMSGRGNRVWERDRRHGFK